MWDNTRKVLGPMFEDRGPDGRGIYTHWDKAQMSKLAKIREKREKHIRDQSEASKKQIQVFRTVCPVKEEDNSSIVERLISDKGAASNFIEFQTRPPMPFNYNEKRKLSDEDALIFQQIRNQARIFNHRNHATTPEDGTTTTITGHAQELNEDSTTTPEIHEEEPLRNFAVVVDRVDDDNTDDDNDNVNDYDDDNDDDGAKDE